MRRPSRGRSVGLVAFLFGMTGREILPGLVLRRLLEDLGLSPDASRALLSRMRRHGQLSSRRRGREVDYRLHGEFAAGFRRVRDQSMADAPPWPGHFHVVLYQVPERERAFRDALRRTAVLTGYGVLQPGVLIAPTDRRAALNDLLRNPPARAQVWDTTLAMDTDDAARAASLAWDLPGLAQTYYAHIDRLTRVIEAHRAVVAGHDPTDASEAVRIYVDTLLPALTDTLREPGLPPELMPLDWPGAHLRASITRFAQTFSGTTGPYLDRLLAR